MRRFTTYVIGVLIAGSAVLGAQKVQTAEDLDAAMKKIGPANGALNKAIKSKAWADARQQAQAIETALVDSHHFWVVKRKDDAVKMSDESIAKIRAVREALDQPAPESVALAAAHKEFASTCAGCHKAYRVQDEHQQYVLKGGI